MKKIAIILAGLMMMSVMLAGCASTNQGSPSPSGEAATSPDASAEVSADASAEVSADASAEVSADASAEVSADASANAEPNYTYDVPSGWTENKEIPAGSGGKVFNKADLGPTTMIIMADVPGDLGNISEITEDKLKVLFQQYPNMTFDNFEKIQVDGNPGVSFQVTAQQEGVKVSMVGSVFGKDNVGTMVMGTATDDKGKTEIVSAVKALVDTVKFK